MCGVQITGCNAKYIVGSGTAVPIKDRVLQHGLLLGLRRQVQARALEDLEFRLEFARL